MSLFNHKNDSQEFIRLNTFSNSLEELIGKDEYISKKQYLSFYKDVENTYNDLYSLEKQNVLSDWCKKNDTNFKDLSALLNKYRNIEKIIKNHNDGFLKRHLIEDKEYLDKVLIDDDPNIILDDEQRKVVLSDEDYTLVVAGAGAGKTTTIEAKVKYLTDIKKVDPSRILVISFTKKATEELKKRFKKLQIKPEIATFHSVGNTIIKNNEKVKHIITNAGFMFDNLKEYLTTKLDDEYFIKKILLFFASYLNMPFGEENTALLFKTLNDNGVSTMKDDLKKVLDQYKQEIFTKRRTMKDERVRSLEECRIANFLFINGIDYEYEPIYRYSFKGTLKPYCPDFLLKQGDKRVYLEHFGVSESGENNRFSEEELATYKKHINEKIILHKTHKTRLIYTFSQYNDNKDVIYHLEKLLKKEGFVLNTKDDETIYRHIAKLAEDKYFNKFLSLICTFISRMKTNNYGPSKFDEWKINIKDERTKLFIDIAYQCYLAYSSALKENNAIDFEDMINNASDILDRLYKEGKKLDYDYILVDEYQDISIQRFDLCQKLSKVCDAKIIAVGDDWQSIYRFSGSKIDLFTRFEEVMGYANVLKITKTYRNSQELIDIAGGFVMKNDKQIEKQLKSPKSIKDPIIIMSYDDEYVKNSAEKGPLYRLAEAIQKSIDQIVLEYGEKAKILLIGRYGFEGRNLEKIEDFFAYENNRLVCKKYPKIKLDYMTAHSSKGLGYDNVIIINGKDAVLGFPSKIEDDPVMKLVIKNDENLEYAEERRLFYVALTRTKNRVYIIAPQHHPSSFIVELKENYTNVTLKGKELMPTEYTDVRIACPICGYPMQRRTRKSFEFLKGQENLWICSNDPEICGFVTNDLQGGRMAISKCPDCEDGYLIVKKVTNKDGKERRILGCTNYKKDGTGCNCTMSEVDYTQELSKLSIRFYNENTSLDKIYIAELPCLLLLKYILLIIEKCKAKRIHVIPYTIVSVLIGEKNNVVNAFNLDSLEEFNVTDPSCKGQIFKFIDHLIDFDVLCRNEDEYRTLKVLKKKFTKEELRELISSYFPNKALR